MPLPRVLTSLGAADQAASRTLANVKTALDPVLQFCNTTFQVANDGTLSVLRKIKVFTATTLNSTTSNTTTANAVTSNTSGTSTANSVVSGSGFKSTHDMGIAWASSATVGTRYQCKRFMQNAEAASTYSAPTLFQPLFSGSIVGLHVYSQGTAGGTINVQVYKYTTVPTSSTTPLFTATGASGGQYFGSNFVYAKGLYSFVFNDYYSITCTFSNSGNNFAIITLTVEYGA